MVCSLELVRRSFAEESQWLLDAYVGNLAHDPPLPREPGLCAEMAVVRLHDAWARFSRELVLQSAACAPTTAAGVLIPRAPGIRRRRDVIPVLLATYRKRVFEPRWAAAKEAIDAAQRLRIANLGTVAAALGAMNSPSEEIRLVRNYFAHRSESTVAEIRAHPSLGGRALNWKALASDQVGPGVMRIEQWIIRLRAIAEAAIQ